VCDGMHCEYHGLDSVAKHLCRWLEVKCIRGC
jgi:hypothetical protein